MFYLIVAAFFGAPIAAIVWFFHNLREYLEVRYDDEAKKSKKPLLILSSVIALVLVILVAAVAVLFSLAIANM